MNNRSKWFPIVMALTTGCLLSSLRADVIELKNGDRLTGAIVAAEGGKLKIKSALAGDVEVDLKDLKTFSTDGPITLKLNDGTVVKQTVKADKDGLVAVAPGAVANNTVSIDSIARINPSDAWTGSIVAGAIVTRGDSKTEAFNLSFDATRRSDLDRFNVNGQYLYGRQKNNDTGESTTGTDNWRVGAKYDYFFTPKFYGFAGMNVEKDRIAQLDIRLTPAVGVGYQWVERKDFNFSTEAGLAYIHEKYSNDGTNDTVSLKLAYHLDKQLREGVKLFHNLAYYPSLESLNDYLIATDAGVRADLTERFFTEFKVEWRYDSTPAPDASRSNLRYILGVGWGF